MTNLAGFKGKASRRLEPRTGPPVGVAFVGFTVIMGAAAAASVLKPPGFRDPSPALLSNLATMVATLYCVTAVTCAYRALAGRDRVAGLIAIVLLVGATPWTMLTSLGGAEGVAARSSSFTVMATAVTGFWLLARSVRDPRWLEVFNGLGFVALEVVAASNLSQRTSSVGALPLALLALASASACLYGTLVELEVSQNRTRQDLLALRERYLGDIGRTEGLLHDLRSGLLSIEAAIGAMGSGDVEPVRVEAARLRELTVGTRKGTDSFELVGPIRNLVALKRASGTIIELLAPSSATVWGSGTEILSVVENLLANADRHGIAPVRVEIEAGEVETTVIVSDAGTGIAASRQEAVFERGVTSHPDGSGIGLHRAREFAQQNGGDLLLDLTDGGRTRFVLRLKTGPLRFQRAATGAA